jgi:hypothetical protein
MEVGVITSAILDKHQLRKERQLSKEGEEREDNAMNNARARELEVERQVQQQQKFQQQQKLQQQQKKLQQQKLQQQQQQQQLQKSRTAPPVQKSGASSSLFSESSAHYNPRSRDAAAEYRLKLAITKLHIKADKDKVEHANEDD